MAFLNDASVPMNTRCQRCELSREAKPCSECYLETYSALGYLIWRCQKETTGNRTIKFDRFNDGRVAPYLIRDDWIDIMDRANSSDLDHAMLSCEAPIDCDSCCSVFWTLVVEYASRIHHPDNIRNDDHPFVACHRPGDCDACRDQFMDHRATHFAACVRSSIDTNQPPQQQSTTAPSSTIAKRDTACQTDDPRSRAEQWLQSERTDDVDNDESDCLQCSLDEPCRGRDPNNCRLRLYEQDYLNNKSPP